ncbi:MAG TPA: PQQ-dependent sugar dehydrogenase [Actinomycetota bacterium]|nr:PQQ-dependent sugar dehydrogenase [Actinomycetota bacterium]
MKRSVVFVVAVLLLPACGKPPEGVLVRGARDVTAMVPFDGGLLYGERTTGRILDLDGKVHARVRVSSKGQRGLLGLAVDEDRNIFASWTRPDLRLVVAKVAPGPQRLVWLGPRSTDLYTGGHIAISPEDGVLAVGVGDLQDPGAVSDSKAPNGKILKLDPDGGPDQKWTSYSYGWNNPFAFDFTEFGALWLADNAPGGGRERLGRADPVGPNTYLPSRTAPSGLAVAGDKVFVCGFRTRLLLRYRVLRNQAARPEGPPVARDCLLGVVELEDGRLAYSTGTSIKAVYPES